MEKEMAKRDEQGETFLPIDFKQLKIENQQYQVFAFQNKGSFMKKITSKNRKKSKKEIQNLFNLKEQLGRSPKCSISSR